MINRIQILNFRSLANVTVELGPLTVLIGRSGTGKSNFVDAIRFLRDSLRARKIEVGALGGVDRVLHTDHKNEPLSYYLQFSLDGVWEPIEYGLVFDPATQQVLDEVLKLGEITLFHQALGKWEHIPEVESPANPNGIMLGAIRGLQASTVACKTLVSGIGCYAFPSDVLTGQGNHGDPPDHAFADKGENYLLVAERIFSDSTKPSNWHRIERSVRAVNRMASNLTLSAPFPDRLDVAYQFNGKTSPFDVRQESEGLRRFLAHMLAMYQNPPKKTLIFEHPEAGLHPGALESLAHQFKACAADGRSQVILTTHSPQLLDYFPPESLRVVDIEKMETRIGPIASEQMKPLQDGLTMPGDLFIADPARLEGQLAEVPE